MPGVESITTQFENLRTELDAIRIPLLDRSSIKNGIQFVRSLQDENGGFSLSMESTQTSPLMTGYGIWAYGTCGLGKENKDVVRALKFLKECQGSDGGFPFYLGSSQALTPTAIIANAMIELGFEHSGTKIKMILGLGFDFKGDIIKRIRRIRNSSRDSCPYKLC